MPTPSPNSICILKRSLDGLKQALKIWFEKFQTALFGFSFTQRQYSPSLFLQRIDKGIVVLIIYADDIVVSGFDQDAISEIKQLLHSTFHIKELS